MSVCPEEYLMKHGNKKGANNRKTLTLKIEIPVMSPNISKHVRATIQAAGIRIL